MYLSTLDSPNVYIFFLMVQYSWKFQPLIYLGYWVFSYCWHWFSISSFFLSARILKLTFLFLFVFRSVYIIYDCEVWQMLIFFRLNWDFLPSIIAKFLIYWLDNWPKQITISFWVMVCCQIAVQLFCVQQYLMGRGQLPFLEFWGLMSSVCFS